MFIHFPCKKIFENHTFNITGTFIFYQLKNFLNKINHPAKHKHKNFVKEATTLNNQQQSTQPQQPIMPQPPNVLTTKDHLYLTDMLSWNLVAMKKAYHFANECIDQEVKQAIEKAGQMHQRHYEKLLSHLQAQPMQSQQSNQPNM